MRDVTAPETNPELLLSLALSISATDDEMEQAEGLVGVLMPWRIIQSGIDGAPTDDLVAARALARAGTESALQEVRDAVTAVNVDDDMTLWPAEVAFRRLSKWASAYGNLDDILIERLDPL